MFFKPNSAADVSLALARGVLLMEVSWPATKDELIVRAAQVNVPLQLLEELFMLPDDGARYDALQLAPPPQGAA